MEKRHIPVGIYDKEIFIIELEDGTPHCGIDGKPCFDVVRPVTEEQLDYLRDMDKRREEYKDFWVEAVRAGDTEDGFDEWLEDVWSEEMDEDDPESFPAKDDSYCQYIEEVREEADSYLGANGVDVGTWEAAGSYPPSHDLCHDDGWYSDFEDWDYVFDNPEAREWAEYAKKVLLG